jgi:enoyl-CoA hydratase/carnithine racemase
LIFDDDRAVAEVRLVRPEVRNAQTMATWASLAKAAEIIAGRSDVAVVVLRGAGEDFSAGLDLRMMRGTGLTGEGDLGELARHDDTELDRAITGFQRGFVCWRELPAIVVAVITGHAIGAGFQLALAADLRVLRDDAVLVMAEARLGLVPDLGGTRRLLELVGYARALELCATALPVDAQRAERLGLASVVLAADEFEAGLERFLGTLLAIDPVVTRSVKTLLAHAATATAAEQLATERRTQLPLLRAISGSSG